MRPLLAFYQNFLWPLNLINAACCVASKYAPPLAAILYAFWIKAISIILIGVYVEVFQSNKFYFFYNLGYSKKSLYAGTILIDLIIWSVCLSLSLIVFS